MRRQVLELDEHRCRVQWDEGCTIEATECDHIVSVWAGGTESPANLRASCSHCNAARNVATRPRPRTARRPTEPPPGLIG